MVDLRLKSYGGAAAVFALDRLTKWLIESRVSFTDTYRVIPGFFDIVRSQNRGVAFGILDDSSFEWRTTVLIVATLAAVVTIGIMLWNASKFERLTLYGLVLVLGGASGNLFDRIVWGRVTDFLLIYIRDYQWPTFNVADSAIVTGCGLLLLDQFRGKRQAAHVS